MTATAGVLDELLDAAKALGVMRPDGSIDTAWFSNPLDALSDVFGDDHQRQALLALLDAVLPPGPGVAPAGEHWYPLLGGHAGPHANAYLTIASTGGETIVGVAGSLGATIAPGGGSPTTGSLSLRVPVLRATATEKPTPVVGSSTHPASIDIRVTTELTAAADGIGLTGVMVSFTLTSAGVTARIALEGLDLGDGSGVQPEVVLDPAGVAPEALHVVVALLRRRFHDAAVDPALAPSVHALAEHLPALLGLGSIPGLDPVPLLDGAGALRTWFQHLTDGASPPIATWLTHLAGLLGISSPVTGDGTDAAPWTITIPVGAAAHVELWCARTTSGDSRTPVLRIGASVVGGTGPAVEGGITLFEIPLSGVGATAVMPAADVVLRAPADPDGFLVGPDPADPVRVRSLRAGFRWNGSQMIPMLELSGVDFEGVHHERIDLHDGQSVVNSAASLLESQIAGAIGSSTRAIALAALVGLQDPPGTSGWPSSSRVDIGRFAANPLPEIARVHRAVLTDATHEWSAMLSAVALAVGLPDPVTVDGAGTADDPWRVGIATSGALALQLVAWNANAGAPGGDAQLRVGLRLAAQESALRADAVLELLAFDLPASGAATIRFAGGVHVSAHLSALPDAVEAAGVAVSATALGLNLDWAAGSSLRGGAVVENVTVSSDGTTVTVPALRFPPGPATPSNPLAGFGVSDTAAVDLARLLLARAAIAWGGMAGHVLAGLFGLHRDLAGVADDAPLLTDGGAAPFTHPLQALRAFMGSVLTAVDGEGRPVAASWLVWLAGLVSGAVPDTLDALPAVAITGAGTYDDPWALPVAAGSSALVWLEPGPPGAWASAAASAVTAATDADSLVDALSRMVPSHAAAAEVLGGRSAPALADGVSRLADHLASSDGVVPIASQAPAAGGWTAGTASSFAHARVASDPAVIAQVTTQLAAWSHGAVLLIGPRFLDAGEWGPLLAAASAGPPVHVDFRAPGLDAAGASLDLTGLATAGWYTSDLRDDGGTDPAPIVSQLTRLVDAIASRHSGQPVAIVAHSTAAVAARAYAAAAGSSRVAGVIAIAAPLLGAPLTPIVDPTVADAVRAVRSLVPSGLGDAELDAAVDHLVGALDGFAPSATATAEPPVAHPYPVGSFAGSADVDLGGVPGLAIGSRLAGDLVAQLRTALASLASAAASAAVIPTHAGFGFRSSFGTPAVGDSVTADAHLRVDIGRLRLPATAAPEPARPATRAEVRLALARRGGWLAGSPTSVAGLGAPPIEVRARRVDLGLAIEADGAGGVRLTPSARIVDGAVRGVPVSGGISNPGFAAALGAAFRGAASPPPVAGGGLATVLGALEKLGIAVDDGAGGIGLANDAVNAIAVDAAGFLGPRLRAALAAADGLLGLSGPAGGPWTADLPGGLRLTLTPDPWRIGLQSNGAFTVGGAVVDLDVGVALPDFTPHFDVTVHAGRVRLGYQHATGHVRVEAPPWTDGIDLWPSPDAAALQAARDTVVPRLVLSAAVSAVLERVVGPAYLIAPIDAFLADPGAFLSGSSGSGGSGGGGSDRGLLDPARITTLLQTISSAAGLPAGPGLTLFDEITITATGTDTTRITVAKPEGGTLIPAVGMAVTVDIDTSRHVTPGGTVTVNVPLPTVGGITPHWPSLDLAVGVASDGVSLTVTPHGGNPIHLLPHFGGFGELLGSAAALLPALLNELVSRIPSSPAKTATIAVAADLQLCDTGGDFTVHADNLAALVQPGALASLAAHAPAAIADLAGLLGGIGLPGTVSPAGNTVTWTSAGVSITAGWTAGGPTLEVGVAGLAPAGSPVHLSVTAGCTGTDLTFDVIAALDPPPGLGIPFQPAVHAAMASGGLTVTVLPLGAARATDLSIALAPTPALTGDVAHLVEDWLLPLAATIAADAAEAAGLFGLTLWSGVTVAQVLQAAGLIDTSNHLAAPLPSLSSIPGNLVRGFVHLAGDTSPIDIPLAANLHLTPQHVTGRFGLRVHGFLEIDTSSLSGRVLFGGTDPWNSGPDSGVTLLLFDDAGPFAVHPALTVVGLGLGLSGKDGAALLDTSAFKLGSFDAGVSATIDGSGVTDTGVGATLHDVGLPLALLGGPGQGSSNPVAASLLGGGMSGGGDTRAVNPAVSVSASWTHTEGFRLELVGGAGPVWIPLHRSFGPIYIDQIGVDLPDPADPAPEIMVDGSVHVGPLLAQVDDLSVTIPIAHIHQPDHWHLDLRGLAVAFDQPPVSIAGGLVKNPGPPVEYDGMIHVQVTDLGISAVGGYSRPTDAGGEYTSLFVFAALSYPLGGPPFLFVTGLGGGFGYNRELHPPQEITEIPGFFLVAAIDDNSLANDPMGALAQIGSRVPAKRGSMWLAAGLRFSTFVVVETTAVAYAVLDRGFELGLLGVSRMALPEADVAVVSVELALKARFSSQEALLSVQAQLTDNSWIFTRDCQLTGGFAFFMWFREHQFVLTLGGYHPAFQRPDNFPVVPRLGFRWRVGDALMIKGEAYFALTNSCVMLGGRLEATFEAGPVRAWFIAYADILIAWDPFAYKADIGVSIGVSFTAEVCFFACVHIHVSVSLGAQLHIAGPPLHGSVTIEYWVLSLTIPFGSDPVDRPVLTWPQFRDRYVTAGDPSGAATNARVTAGLLPPDPPGAAAAAGTGTDPWKVGAEYAFAVDTRLAAQHWMDFLSTQQHDRADVGEIDLAPMGPHATVTTLLELALTTATGAPVTIHAERWQITSVASPMPEATWRYNDDVPAAARNILAITGLRVAGVAEPLNRSDLIPIATLVDDFPEQARPLPFASAEEPARIATLHQLGAAADDVRSIAAKADSQTLIGLAHEVLSDGSHAAAAARRATGLPSDPVPEFAVASVRRRSAPPLVAPLATGLTMDPVGRGEPPVIDHAVAEPVLLEEPRLRAVLRHRPVAPSPATAGAATATHVSHVAAAKDAPRMTPPTMATAAAASLRRVPDPEAARPTLAAVAARTLRSADLGMAVSVREHDALVGAAAALVADGVVVAAGAVHVWDLPGGSDGARLRVEPAPDDALARVVCLARSGAVLFDGPALASVPPGTRTVVIECLGRGATGGPAGWTASSTLAQVGATTLLCRGGSVRLSRPSSSRRRRHRAVTGMVRAAEAVAGAAVETTLPLRTQVVVVFLDLADGRSADAGDLAVGITGASVADPVQVDAPRHRALLYDVTAVEEDAPGITVAVMSATGWQVTGTVGLTGRAAEWAARFSAAVPDGLVADGPTTPDGAVTVAITLDGLDGTERR